MRILAFLPTTKNANTIYLKMTSQTFNNTRDKQAPYIQQAKNAIKEFFRWRKAPFHFRQLQVLFETQFFHITTTQAIYELINEGLLHPFLIKLVPTTSRLWFPLELLRPKKTNESLNLI